MPLPHIDTIGPHQFTSLEGTIYRPSQQVEVFSRIGLNGVGVRKTGIQGKPFRLISTNFVAPVGESSGFAEAQTLYQSYQLLIGTGAVSVQRNTVLEGLFHVVDIQEAHQPLAVVNAMVADIFYEIDAVLQRVAWVLIAE